MPATPLASPTPTTSSASSAPTTPLATSVAAPPSASPEVVAPHPASHTGSSSSSPAVTPDSLPRPMTRSRAGTFRPSRRYTSDEYLLATFVSTPSPLPS
ncbi:hypothetical protein ZWY2020_003641 [Hordeum vulgare]|nr:hypothetical protein ZWY2020_003641 [Hordeum vulgare]